MKKKLLLSTVLSFVMAFAAFGQASNLVVGWSPFAMNHVGGLTINEKSYRFNYKPQLVAFAAFESQAEGRSIMYEFMYSRNRFDEYQMSDDALPLAVNPGETMSWFDLMTYHGVTLNAQRRLQFPLYFGFGAGYLTDKTYLHHVLVEAGVKARAKFYITNSIGLFGGVTAKAATGIMSQSEDKEYKGVFFGVPQLSAEVGLSIGFGI